MLFETPDVADREKLLSTLTDFEDQLLEAGYVPAASQPATSPVTVTVNPTPAGNSFAARELVCELLDKKPYWKIIGAPPYHKFGVRVWPETLEAAGIDIAKVNPLEGLDLTGWTAHWELRPSAKASDGQTKVVVGLSR
jgi:hypothetical protein